MTALHYAALRLQEIVLQPYAAFFCFSFQQILAKTSRPFHFGDYSMPRKSKRRSWTSSDVRTLKTMARRKTGAASIARTLKRTEGATRQKAFSLGLSLDSRS
jgi:hypothetical protein